MYGGGASLGLYSGAYSGMYDDDTCDDDRAAAAAASLVGEDESVSCPCVSCCLITPLEIIIMTSAAYIIIVNKDMDYKKEKSMITKVIT